MIGRFGGGGNDSFRDLPDISRFSGKRRPPTNRKKAPVRPTGPKYLGLSRKPKKAETSVWTVPPPGFLHAHNSVDEWQVYLAISMHLKDPPNPFQPPFVGGESWKYQKAQSAGGIDEDRFAGRVPGGSVSDYAIANPDGTFLIISLDTERYHIFADAATQEKDRAIDVNLRGVSSVIHIYSQDFIFDTTGQTVMKIIALALQGIQWHSPTGARSALRVRRPR